MQKLMGVASLQSERGQNLNFAIPVQIVNAALAGIDQKKPAAPLSIEGITSVSVQARVLG